MAAFPHSDVGPVDGFSEAAALVNVPLHRRRHNTVVSQPAISRWARSIGDRNPLWMDPSYASGSVLGCILAPPCWLYSVDDTCVAPKLPGHHVLYGGTEWEFYQWATLGDNIESESRLVGVEEKTGRFCGTMVLQTGETVFKGPSGRTIAKATSRVLRTPRQAAVDAGKYLDWVKHVFSAEEAAAVEDAYDAEVLRGRDPRYWEETPEGSVLTPIVRGPLTSEEIIQFGCATRPAPGFRQFLRHRQRHPGAAFLDPETGSWESWEASMLRDEVAQMFGFPFAHDMGIDRISWVSNLVTNWMGDHGFLRNLNVKLTLPNVYGDATWCYGKVNRTHQDRGRNLAELDLWCENQRGEQTAYGNATVELPTKSMGASQDRPLLTDRLARNWHLREQKVP